MNDDNITYAELMAILANSSQLLNAATLAERRKEWITLEQSLEQRLAQCAEATETGYELAIKRIEKNASIAAQAREELDRMASDLPANNPESASTVEQIRERIAELERSQESRRQQAEQHRQNMATFNITLFGRTMSGKSTLMEILTHGCGDSIGRGSQRTTKDVRTYPWQGLTITDVPGIAAYGGEEDEDTAHEAAEKADLVLFLINDSPQPDETEHLARLRQRGHKILGVYNVNKALKGPAARKLFIRDQSKIFNDTDMDQISKQFNELAEQYGASNAIPLISTHLLSKFQADRMSPSAEKDQLEIASRFWQVESHIVQEVATKGTFLRESKFLELATAATLEGMDTTGRCAQTALKLHETLSAQTQQIQGWHNQFKNKARREIDRLARDTVGKLRDQIPNFVNHYYEDKNLADRWNGRVQSAGIDQRTQDAQKRLYDEFRQRVQDLVEELEEETRLANINLRNVDAQTGKIHDTRKWWNRGVTIAGIGLGGVTASLWASGSILGWNPVGWALMGAGAILGLASLLGGLFKSRDTKRREAAAKITPQLHNNLNGIESSIRDAMNKSLQQINEQFEHVHLQLKAQSQSCAQTAHVMDETSRKQKGVLLGLNRQTIDLTLRHIGDKAMTNEATKVARLPGIATVVSTKRSHRLPDEVRSEIESWLKETIVQVDEHPSTASIREALDKERDHHTQRPRSTEEVEDSIAERLASQLNGGDQE